MNLSIFIEFFGNSLGSVRAGLRHRHAGRDRLPASANAGNCGVDYEGSRNRFAYEWNERTVFAGSGIHAGLLRKSSLRGGKGNPPYPPLSGGQENANPLARQRAEKSKASPPGGGRRLFSYPPLAGASVFFTPLTRGGRGGCLSSRGGRPLTPPDARRSRRIRLFLSPRRLP